MSDVCIHNIAIVGASGRSGSMMLNSLLATKKFMITVISRSESEATFPVSVEVKKGDYESIDFLTSALQGQDAVIITLSPQTPKDFQFRLITAAAEANVRYILPNEWGPDPASKKMSEGLPLIIGSKKLYRDQIEALGKSSWISVVCGLWFDFSLAGGFFDLDIPGRKVALYDEGTTKLATSTLPHVGKAVAALISLPISTLDKYKNNFFYTHSFRVSQLDMFHSLLKATNTTESEWTVTKTPVDEIIAQGSAEFSKGNHRGLINVLHGTNLKEGTGGDHGEKSDNQLLGLEQENFDEAVLDVVKSLEKK